MGASPSSAGARIDIFVSLLNSISDSYTCYGCMMIQIRVIDQDLILEDAVNPESLKKAAELIEPDPICP